MRTTARLVLRRPTLDDLPVFSAISMDPATNEHRPGGAPSQAECAGNLQWIVDGWARDGIGYWLAELAGEVVGIAGVRPRVLHGLDVWNLYYRFAPAVWGQGVAGEAVRETLAVAREREPSRLVTARTRADNTAAIALAQSVGLVRRAELDTPDDGLIAFAEHRPAS